jgi:DNA-binding transcriptional ArsR family regulator
MHEHCQKKKLAEFREWAIALGGPYVSGRDPLPWLQAKYVYIETGQQVADLDQRPTGGIWLWELADWSKKHPGRITPPGRENAINLSNAFIEDDKTRKVVSTKYKPVSQHRDTGIVDAFKQATEPRYEVLRNRHGRRGQLRRRALLD